MKTKKLDKKKLSLNQETIANLATINLSAVRGGDVLSEGHTKCSGLGPEHCPCDGPDVPG